MKKLSLSLFAFFLSMYSIADDSGICGDNLSWTYNEASKTLTIIGSGKMNDYSTMTLYSSGGGQSAPWYKYRDNLQTVILGDGITYIGRMAFSYCPNLNQVTIPNNIKSIGPGAFADCI